MNKKHLLAALLSGAVSVGAVPAYAQTTGGRKSDDAPAAEGESSGIAEIIVTAQKRQQSLNDVGLTIAAINADVLAQKNISSLQDVAQAVPGLTFSTSPNNTPVYTLRGVGFYESSLAAYPTVSVYQDEVSLPLPVMTTLSAFDLERIEVLKGPQGTLFGNNATGGAINYVVAKPTNHIVFGGDFGFGRFNTIEMNAYAGGPITDELTFRVSGRVRHGDDWQKSYTRNDSLGKARQYAGRVQFNWKPSDGVNLLLNFNGWQDRSDPLAVQYVAYNPQSPSTASPALVNYPFSPHTPRAADWSTSEYGSYWSDDPTPRANNKMGQVSLRADVDVTDTITLTSLSAYARYTQRQVIDTDGQQIVAQDVIQNDGHINTFSQELRLANDSHSAVRWVVGGNYERTKTLEDDIVASPDASTSTVNGIRANRYIGRQNMRNYAGFANIEYDIVPQIVLKGGIRYTHSERTADICGTDIGDGVINNLFAGIYAGVTGNTVLLQPGDCFSLNDRDGTFLPGAPFLDTLKEHNVSWRAGVDYKPSRDLLLYANLAKGYKAGSYPVAAAAIQSQYNAVTQESVMSYEAGFKATFANRRVSLNGAVFYYDYKDKQLRSKTVVAPFGILDKLQNIPKSWVKGAEISATVIPVDGLTINGQATYTKARVDEFVGINAAGVSADFAGARVPFSPTWQAGASFDYKCALNDRWGVFIGGDIDYSSKAVSIVGGERVVQQSPQLPVGMQPYILNARTLLNAQVGVDLEDGRFRAFIWAKNLTNKYYWVNAVAAFDTVGRYVGRPRTFGVTAAFKY